MYPIAQEGFLSIIAIFIVQIAHNKSGFSWVKIDLSPNLSKNVMIFLV